MNDQKTCLVIQGFGEKTDLSTGRVLNLDASYEVIKGAVEQAGLKCMRVDELIHSGTIDLTMYELLHRADLVIADLSTSNLNVAYELGIRYGLRRSATIVVGESEFKNSFDVGPLVILRYEHLGKDIGRTEALRFTHELTTLIAQVLKHEDVDSPVYTFLELEPPTLASHAPSATINVVPLAPPANSPPDARLDAKVSTLVDGARQALRQGDFQLAKSAFQAVRAARPQDPWVIRQLALATYKSKEPDALTALLEARTLLDALQPETTNDSETLGLWGSIHQELWDVHYDRQFLDTAINAHERGFYLTGNYFSGANLAFLLDVRAALEQKNGDVDGEGTADAVLSLRARRAVIDLCKKALELGPTTGRFSANSPEEEKYWILATLWESAVGVGDESEARQWQDMLERQVPSQWMVESTTAHIAKLRELLASSPLRQPDR